MKIKHTQEFCLFHCENSYSKIPSSSHKNPIVSVSYSNAIHTGIGQLGCILFQNDLQIINVIYLFISLFKLILINMHACVLSMTLNCFVLSMTFNCFVLSMTLNCFVLSMTINCLPGSGGFNLKQSDIL